MQPCSTNLPFPPTFGPSFDNRDQDGGMELYIVIIRESARYYFTDLWGIDGRIDFVDKDIAVVAWQKTPILT